MCNETEVLRCYGFPDSECNCSEKLLPTELKHMKHNSLPYGPHYAVLLAGQTRSFYSDFMLDFWKHFLDRFNDVALLAVLSKVSTQKVKDSGLAELKLNTKTNETIRKSFFKTRNLVASVISLNTSLWNVLVLNDACQWPVAAKAVQDPALRAMLSPPRNIDPKGSGGWSNGYRAKVIAFDLMLRMEANIKQRFKHVLVLRPDVVTDLGQDPAFSASMINSMYFFNDLVAFFPQPYATWFFTHLATGRTLTGLGPANDQDAWDSLIGQLHSRYSTDHTLLWPMAHAAFHGIPFCGGHLQAIPAIPCTPSVNTEIWIMRDRFKARGQNICIVHIDTRHRERRKQLQIYLTALGMNTSLFENIEVCNDTRNRR